MSNNKYSAEFQFYYTNRYKETVSFYRDMLLLEEVRSWDRSDLQKGTFFSISKWKWFNRN